MLFIYYAFYILAVKQPVSDREITSDFFPLLLLEIEIPKDAWTMQKKEKSAKNSNHEISKNPRRRPPPVVSKLSRKCPNILVLHGWGQNGTMLKNTMKKLIKKLQARLHFLSGPHEIPCKSKIEIDGSLVEIENHSPEKDERAWFLYEPLDHAKVPEDFLDQTRPYIGISNLQALKKMDQFILDTGCFLGPVVF